jgi:large subunit ribosomal protein L34e
MKRSERTKKKKAVRVPGGRSEVHMRKKKTSKKVCGICGKQLHGVPHGKTTQQVKQMAKTKKRPERVFGGVLCSKCVREVIKLKARLGSGLIKEKELDLRFKHYIDMLKGVIHP